jgi:hypothetical protein
MKNKLIPILALVLLLPAFTAPSAQAKSAIVGDILLQGTVERSGQKLLNDASIFAGDSIRTHKASGGVLRLAQGRVEMGELSEVEIVGQHPLRLMVKSGVVALNFPQGTPLEIVTPQLEVHPNPGRQSLSAIVNATPQAEDRFQSRSGDFTVIERQRNGKSSHIMPGQIIVATLLPAVALPAVALEPIAPPQGPMAGPRIAVLSDFRGDVRVARSALPNNFARVVKNVELAADDLVRTLNGRATVTFDSDQSVITLTEGTTIQVQQQVRGQTITRRVTQYIGSIWFRIQRVTGTQTTLQTPTAVAAIRGTEGTQDVPNDNESTHALNEGVVRLTEVVSQQSVTIRSGQRVTAIRGVGFTPIVALLAAITQPLVGAGGGAGGGAGAGGAGGGAAGAGAGAGAAAGGATAGVATASTVTTVAAVGAGAVAATTGAVAALVPNVARQTQTASQTVPLNPPGGG